MCVSAGTDETILIAVRNVGGCVIPSALAAGKSELSLSRKDTSLPRRRPLPSNAHLLFIEVLDETRFFQLGDKGVVYKLLGLGRFARRVDGKVEQGLHGRRGNARH